MTMDCLQICKEIWEKDFFEGERKMEDDWFGQWCQWIAKLVERVNGTLKNSSSFSLVLWFSKLLNSKWKKLFEWFP
jgi:hypothetical protein